MNEKSSKFRAKWVSEKNSPKRSQAEGKTKQLEGVRNLGGIASPNKGGESSKRSSTMIGVSNRGRTRGM